MTRIEGAVDALDNREKDQEKTQREMAELESAIRGGVKEIDHWYNRAQNEPGYYAPPDVEEINPQLKAHLER